MPAMGVMLWMASPISVTVLAGQAGTGAMLRTITVATVLGSERVTIRCSPGVPSGDGRGDGPLERRAVLAVEKGGGDVLASGGVRPEQVVLRGVHQQPRRLLPGWRSGGTHPGAPPVALPHRGEQERVLGRHDVADAGTKAFGQPGPDLVGQGQLAGYGHHPGVDPVRLRQVLPADGGVGAVGGDEDVAPDGGAVGEVRGHGGVVMLFVVHELPAELHDVLKLVKQQVAQCDTADGVVLPCRVAVAAAAGDQVVRQVQQLAKVLGEEAEPGRRLARRGQELRPELVGQAGFQGAGSVRVDVDALALEPVVAHQGAFVHRHLGPRSF